MLIIHLIGVIKGKNRPPETGRKPKLRLRGAEKNLEKLKNSGRKNHQKRDQVCPTGPSGPSSEAQFFLNDSR